MSKLQDALVTSSQMYREMIYSSLRSAEILPMETTVTEEKCTLLHYVKKYTANITNYDVFIIDLGALQDTDEEIMEAVELLRYIDDNIRIVILESTRPNSYKLLHECFLNGVYNLIKTDDFINTNERLKKALLEGMSYKDVLNFKEETRKTTTQKEDAKQDYSLKTVAFFGTQPRIGATHCVLTAAYTLMCCGYLVAVVNYTNKDDYLKLMYGYEESLNENNSFSVDNIDFYICADSSGNNSNFYNFILYDCGCAQIDAVEADEKVLVAGSKTWELPFLSSRLKEFEKSEEKVKILFNFTIPEMEEDLLKLMKQAQVEENIYFMDYTADFFSFSEQIKNLLEAAPKVQKKQKKGWFRKHKRRF